MNFTYTIKEFKWENNYARLEDYDCSHIAIFKDSSILMTADKRRRNYILSNLEAWLGDPFEVDMSDHPDESIHYSEYRLWAHAHWLISTPLGDLTIFIKDLPKFNELMILAKLTQ